MKQPQVLLKSVTHQARLQILCDLMKDEKSVSEFQQYSNFSASAFSEHLQD